MLEQFVNEYDVQVRRLSDEQLVKIGEVAGEVISEIVETDAMSKKVFESMNKFRAQQKAYSSTTEFDFLYARNLDYKWPA